MGVKNKYCMVIENMLVYKCDHCGKKQFRKCDMTQHEKWCKENPSNMHKCFQFCPNLIKTEEEYEGCDHYEPGDTYVGKKTVFTCAKTGQKMYSFKAEKRKLPVVNEEGVIRMPLQCEHFKDPYEIITGIDELSW